ncbi:MAG: WecB/TagA/CpsF family glycosyltransferase [Clostridium sp.]|nr:WecB/TagA/CpsF family glycosyltransferase [Clostridium sp.]MCM1444673.1 WecB/TagA/CpsF family glycosyltransferase [Candidatus Amulumruptor caecigallinarius]
MRFCNLNINITNKKELFEIDLDKPKCIVTLNAQIIRLANTNKDLYEFVNNNYATIDGQIPLVFAKMTNKEFKNVIKLPGSEIVFDFCEYAKKNNMKLYFLGGKEESNKEAVKKIKEKYGINVDGYSPAYEDYPFSKKFLDDCISHLKKAKPDIVFVGFGAPKQEFFMRDNIDILKECGVKFAIGSGGTVDFVSGKVKRAPKFISKMGLEGFYRLFKEFNKARFKRIIYSFGFFKYIYGKPSFEKKKGK